MEADIQRLRFELALTLEQDLLAVTQPIHSDPSQVPFEIDAMSAVQLLAEQPDAVMLDCRTHEEYAIARIDRAILIPMDEITSRSDQLEPFRDKPLIVHCHHGGRSQMVTQWLRKMGFSQARNLTGGIDAWSQLVDNSIPRY